LPGRYAAARGGRRVPAAINGQPRPPGTRAPTTTIEFDIPGPTWAELRAAATSIGATAPTLLLAALADLLGRHTGQDHVMVGIPVRSRERPVPVRIDLSDRPAYIEIIKQLQAELAAAVRHGDADVGALLEAVEAGARTARPPEFQMMFDCLCEKDALYGAGQWEPGLRATVAYADPARARLDLTLQVNAGDGPVRVSLRYPTDLFSGPALRGAADELSTRLDAIAGEMAIGPTPCPAPAARSRSATV
jgi:non-ribosomal peptide synthetase component F